VLRPRGRESRKGKGFVQPLTAHEHWHNDVAYINIAGTFVFMAKLGDHELSAGGGKNLQRVNIETDIENVKVRLEGEELKGKSADAAQKERSVIILHYQLIAATRMTAAKKHKVPARKLGFTDVRECFRNYFERAAGRSQKMARQHFLKALDPIANCKIPHRPGRSCKRECYHQRTRGDSFPGRRIKNSDNLTHGTAKTT
jgi:hypothetical protein